MEMFPMRELVELALQRQDYRIQIHKVGGREAGDGCSLQEDQ